MADVSVPDGYHSVNPYIVVEGVQRLIDFLGDVLDGVERGEREIRLDSTIGHAEVRIGDSLAAPPAWKVAAAVWPTSSGVPMMFLGQVDLPDTELTRRLLTATSLFVSQLPACPASSRWSSKTRRSSQPKSTTPTKASSRRLRECSGMSLEGGGDLGRRR